MLLIYDLFYRLFGVRRAEQLLTPPLKPVERLALPRGSILHYTSSNPLEGGPAVDDFIFRNVTKPIQMGHVTEVGNRLGNPRRMAVPVDSLIRKYHLQRRRFRLMRNLEVAARDENTLVVYNYGFIPQIYIYMRSYYSDYYKWMNTEAAVWKNIAKVAEQSPRHQFVLCKLPTILPSLSELRIGSSGQISQRMVQIFSSPESLMLLELWKWFGPERATSMLAEVPDKYLSRVNLIFIEAGVFFAINLGLFNSWRKATEMELQNNPDAPKKGLPPEQMQRRFLRLMISLQHARTVGDAEVDAADAAEVEVAKIEPTKVAGKVEVKPGVKPSAKIEIAPEVTKVPVGVPKKGDDGVIKATFLAEKDIQALAEDTSKQDTAEDVLKATTVELEKKIEAELAELETIAAKAPSRPKEETPEPELVEVETLEQGVTKVCDRLADLGMLSAAEYRRYNELASTYRKIPAPDGSGETLDRFIAVPQEKLKIEPAPVMPEKKTVLDKSMLQSSLVEFDKRYIRDVMQRDVAAMVLNTQRAGLAVTSYDSELVQDVLGSYHDFTVRVVPVEGSASTFRFKLPALEDDGTYMANGVKYRMRKQRGDLPIRKIGPDRVALTSYYGKSFVSRSSKKVNDYGQWLRNQVMAKGLDPEDTTITELQPADVFDNTFKAPKVYTTLAMGFRAFTVSPKTHDRTTGQQNWLLNFDHTQREKLFGVETLKSYEQRGSIVIGKSRKGLALVLDKNGMVYVGEAGNLRDLGTIEQFLGLEAEKAPVDFAELKVLGRSIPVGVVLGYEMGLERLMKLLGVTPRRVPAGQRANIDQSEFSLVFSDETLVFSRDNPMASMVLAGFNEYHRTIRVYSVHEFDRPAVYLNVLETQGPSTRYLREIDLLYRMFVDPITRDLLVEMKEPTDFRGLLMRSCQMLLEDTHPDELDPAYMRIKGYERMAGAVYSELVRSLRAHSGRAGRTKLPIDLNPYAVWKTISQDPAISLVSDINPIENLKQMEAVTYSGVGGRNSRSMTKHTRAYHKNDMGTISESTVDSSDVAINTFTSADPQFTSLRGISRRFDKKANGPAALLSTSALVSVGSDRDDPKRVNFIAIQQSHGVACEGYTQMPVRTGYEQVIAHRTSDLFAYTAKQDGEVVQVSDSGMIVKFADGELRGFELGRRFGAAAGLTIPHEVKTEMKAGQRFKAGALLCYNPGFFERDLLNPEQVVWKAGLLVRTVLLESTQTLEDSSAISERVAKLLSTKTTKVKNIVVNFDQSVRKLVREGQAVESEDILCIIEDAVTANSELFDEESLDTLRVLSNQTPQAKAKGVVERVEVFYHGDKEDMSESLRAIASASDREMGKRNRAAGKPAYSGSVNDGFRIDGDPLQLDTACIRVYITADVAAGVGDKGVFCNQMKTVFGEVMQTPPVTESGKTIDAVFGQKSIADRIVLSPEIIGTTTTLLDVIGQKAVAAYYGRK